MRYLAKHREARAVFLRFFEQGPKHVNRHLLSITSLLGPLRRCCSGGALRERVSATSHLYACYACVHLNCLDSPMMHCWDPCYPPVHLSCANFKCLSYCCSFPRTSSCRMLGMGLSQGRVGVLGGRLGQRLHSPQKLLWTGAC